MLIDGVRVDARGIELKLDGILDKLERAHEHREQFQVELREFLDTDPYGALGEIEGEHGWYVFRVEVRRPIPPRLGVLFGEWVHQVRSSLDHLIWELARWHLNRTPPIGTVFPIQTGRAGAERLMARLKGRIPDDFHAAIERLQPIGTDNDHPLVALERLWNRDKHATVIPIPEAETLTLGHIEYRPNRDAGNITERRPRSHVRLEEGAELARVKIAPVGPDPRVDMYVLSPLYIRDESGISLTELGPLSFAEGVVRGLVALFPGGEAALDLRTPIAYLERQLTAITNLDDEAAARKLGFFIGDRNMFRGISPAEGEVWDPARGHSGVRAAILRFLVRRAERRHQR
jgi:hypothetical protein